MTPIERVFRNVSEFVSNLFGSTLNLCDGLGPTETGLLTVIVLGIAALCLRGNPVRGA